MTSARATELLDEAQQAYDEDNLEEASKLILQTFEHQRGVLTHASR